MSRTGPAPGRRTVAVAFLAVGAAAALDVVLGGRLSLFFDLCFVATCVGLGLLARVPDLFGVGMMPPVIMLATFLPLAVLAPDTVAHPRDGVIQALVTGFASHSTALVVGYALCLAGLVGRQRAARRSRVGAELVDSSP